MYIYIYIYIHIHTSLFLSLSIYIYICIYIERERERERDRGRDRERVPGCVEDFAVVVASFFLDKLSQPKCHAHPFVMEITCWNTFVLNVDC